MAGLRVLKHLKKKHFHLVSSLSSFSLSSSLFFSSSLFIFSFTFSLFSLLLFSLLSSLVLCFIFSLLFAFLSSLVFSCRLVLLCLLLSSPLLSLLCRLLFSLWPCLLSLSLSVSVSVSVWCCGRVVVLLCSIVSCVVVCVVWHRENPVCPLKTFPCVPAPRAHVETHARVVPVHKGYVLKCTHEGVFESTHRWSSPVLLTKKSSRRVLTWPQRGSPK